MPGGVMGGNPLILFMQGQVDRCGAQRWREGRQLHLRTDRAIPLTLNPKPSFLFVQGQVDRCGAQRWWEGRQLRLRPERDRPLRAARVCGPDRLVPAGGGSGRPQGRLQECLAHPGFWACVRAGQRSGTCSCTIVFLGIGLLGFLGVELLGFFGLSYWAFLGLSCCAASVACRLLEPGDITLQLQRGLLNGIAPLSFSNISDILHVVLPVLLAGRWNQAFTDEGPARSAHRHGTSFFLIAI